MSPYVLGPSASIGLWHISSQIELISFDPKIKDLHNISIAEQAIRLVEEQCVGNATVCWWTFIVIQHYYVSTIIYGLIPCQFYNWIVATYLHLKKNKSQWKFPLWRTSSGIKCRANQDCFLKPKSGAAPSLVNNQDQFIAFWFCNPFAIFCHKFHECALGIYLFL